MKRSNLNPESLIDVLQYGFSQAVAGSAGVRDCLSGQMCIDSGEHLAGGGPPEETGRHPFGG